MIREIIRSLKESYQDKDKQFIADKFNKFIFDELSASVGYRFIAEQLNGQGTNKVIDELKEHAKEEYEHFTELLHFAFLHGFGDKISIKELDQKVVKYIPKDVKKCVEFIQGLELQARDDYRDMALFARKNNDLEMEDFFKELMADEQEHYDDLAFILNNEIKLGESND